MMHRRVVIMRAPVRAPVARSTRRPFLDATTRLVRVGGERGTVDTGTRSPKRCLRAAVLPTEVSEDLRVMEPSVEGLERSLTPAAGGAR
jgi:hypothetical protein